MVRERFAYIQIYKRTNGTNEGDMCPVGYEIEIHRIPKLRITAFITSNAVRIHGIE